MSGTVLLIGGTDSSGGAGLARDIATAAALGIETRIAVTAVTAQSDASVTDIYPVPPAMVAAQMRAAGPVQAVKTGMLVDTATISAVAGALPLGPLVVDPVLQASSGAALIAPGAADALVRHLLPRASLLTPNRAELRALGAVLGMGGGGEEAVVQGLLAQGAGSVLVKGGHDDDPAKCTDRLYRPGKAVLRFTEPRLPGSLRGTGCQLASAITCFLAAGADLPEAVEEGKRRVTQRFLRRL